MSLCWDYRGKPPCWHLFMRVLGTKLRTSYFQGKYFTNRTISMIFFFKKTVVPLPHLHLPESLSWPVWLPSWLKLAGTLGMATLKFNHTVVPNIVPFPGPDLSPQSVTPGPMEALAPPACGQGSANTGCLLPVWHGGTSSLGSSPTKELSGRSPPNRSCQDGSFPMSRHHGGFRSWSVDSVRAS